GGAHADRVPVPVHADARGAGGHERRLLAFRRRRRALDQGRHEVEGGVLAERAEVLDAAQQEAALHGREGRAQHELVAEARLRLTRDRREELAAVDHLAEPAQLLARATIYDDPAATRARRFVEEMTAALRPLVVAGDDAAADLAQQRAVVGPRGRDAQHGVLTVRRDCLAGLRPEPARRLAGGDGANAVA